MIEAAGGVLVIRQPRDRLRSMLRVTGLDRVLATETG